MSNDQASQSKRTVKDFGATTAAVPVPRLRDYLNQIIIVEAIGHETCQDGSQQKSLTITTESGETLTIRTRAAYIVNIVNRLKPGDVPFKARLVIDPNGRSLQGGDKPLTFVSAEETSE